MNDSNHHMDDSLNQWINIITSTTTTPSTGLPPSQQPQLQHKYSVPSAKNATKQNKEMNAKKIQTNKPKRIPTKKNLANPETVHQSGTVQSDKNPNNGKQSHGKKKNKYEKRRELARLAKQRQCQQQSSVQHEDFNATDTMDELKGEQDPIHSIDIPTVTMDEEKKEATLEHKVENRTTDATTKISNFSPTLKTCDPNTKFPSLLSSSLTRATKIETVPITITSRKRQHDVTRQELQDQHKRAHYMATYHATPYELDRNNTDNTSRYIPPSHDSLHLFSTTTMDRHRNDDQKGKEPDGPSETTLETQKVGTLCPFQACGLHPRLIRTLTTCTKCALFLQRPTIIQQTVWNNMLLNDLNTAAKNLNSDKNRNSSRIYPNYFIQSETGSGKTLAYLIPILQSIALNDTHQVDELNKKGTSSDDAPASRNRKSGGIQAIIFSPTRELTIQTAKLVESICLHSFSWIISGCLSGGEKRKTEKAKIRKGITILITTPGRFLDHLRKTENLTSSLQNSNLKWVVFDESDRLFDSNVNLNHLSVSGVTSISESDNPSVGGVGGLQKQMEEILQILRHQVNQNKYNISKRNDNSRKALTCSWQNILVSATITDRIERFARHFFGSDNWIWNRITHGTTASIDESPFRASHTDARICDTKKTEDEDDQTSKIEELTVELAHATPRQLTQLYIVVSAKLRLPVLVAFLSARVEKSERTVVFMSTCDSVDFHYNLFKEVTSIMRSDSTKDKSGLFGESCPIHRLHGNVDHVERQGILKKFSNISNEITVNSVEKRPAILLTTDVAARGLNLPSVDWIIQYDPPCETADYVHRAGRTARAGKAGHALLFLLPNERQYVDILKARGLTDMTPLSLTSTFLNASKISPHITLEGTRRSGGGLSRDGEAFANAIQNRLEDCIIENDRVHKDAATKNAASNSSTDRVQRRKEKRHAKHSVGPLLEWARLAYCAYIRSYAAKEKVVKHIFSPRALHLGHIARSFALKDTPSSLVMIARNVTTTEQNYGIPARTANDKKRSSSLSFGSRGSKGGSGSKDELHVNGRYNDNESSVKKKKLNTSNMVISRTESSSQPFTASLQYQHSSIQAQMLSAAKKMHEGRMEFY